MNSISELSKESSLDAYIKKTGKTITVGTAASVLGVLGWENDFLPVVSAGAMIGGGIAILGGIGSLYCRFRNDLYKAFSDLNAQ